MELITSRQNRICTEIRRLRSSRSARYKAGLYIADGLKLIQEALRWNADIAYIAAVPEIYPDIPDTLQRYALSPELMEYVSSMDSPQGAIAVIRMPQLPVCKLHPGTLILDHIQDPGNLGTILRTADAFDIPVVLSDGCADPFSEKTVRSSMGAIFRSLPAAAHTDTIIAFAASAALPIAVATLAPDSVDIRNGKVSEHIVVIGNEGHGVSREFMEAAQTHFIIPMTERCESLNAATAATVFMWQQLNEKHAGS